MPAHIKNICSNGLSWIEVPSAYLPIRWCVDRTTSPTEVPSEPLAIECNELVNGDDILSPPKSKPKGRPKNKRQQGGKELAKQIRHCSKCKKAGHYANNCWLDKENAPVSNGAPKKKSKLAASSEEDLNPIFLVKY